MDSLLKEYLISLQNLHKLYYYKQFLERGGITANVQSFV